MQIDHRGTNDNNEKLGQRGREGVTSPTFAVLVVKYFTYLKHTALDRLQVRLNVILYFLVVAVIVTLLCLNLPKLHVQTSTQLGKNLEIERSPLAAGGPSMVPPA